MKKITTYFEKKFFYLTHLISNIIQEILNKYNKFNYKIITVVSLFFLYLFYLSIPAIYNKNWVNNEIKSQIAKDFDLDFEFKKDLSYSIFPFPHFYIIDNSIIKDNADKKKKIADIKNLKIFISQKNLFSRDNLKITKLSLDKSNFLFSFNNLEFIKRLIDKEFSNKKFVIKNSNFLFTEKDATIILTIIKDLSFFFDSKKSVNQLILNGKIFNLNYNLSFEKDFENNTSVFKILSKRIGLELENKFAHPNQGQSELNILNYKIVSDYVVKKNQIEFKSKNLHPVSYNGALILKPFSLKTDISIKKTKIRNILDNEILIELIKSKIFFNKNLDLNLRLNVDQFNETKKLKNFLLNLKFKEGKISFDETTVVASNVGTFEFFDSNLNVENSELVGSSDLIFSVENIDNFYRFFPIPKKLRKKINNIKITYKYNFTTKELEIKNLLMDNKEVNQETKDLIDKFNANKKIKNKINFRNIVNELLSTL